MVRSEIAFEEVDVLLEEIASTEHCGPTFNIRLHHETLRSGTHIRIRSVSLVYRRQSYQLPLGHRLLMFFHDMATHREGRTATAIARDLRVGQYRIATQSGSERNWRIAASSIRVYVDRVRAALSMTLASAHLPLDPCSVVCSRATTSNQVLYFIRARVLLTDTSQDFIVSWRKQKTQSD